MLSRISIIALLVWLYPTLCAAEKNEPLKINITGNRVLLDPVLLHVMELPKTGPATTKLARKAKRRLLRFYRKTGYDLARVETFVNEGVLEIMIEEGRLDKILFTGTSNWKTLNMRLEFALPGDVYNRLQVISELKRLKEKYGFKKLEAKIIKRDPPASTIIQIEDLISKDKLKAAQDFWLGTKTRHQLVIQCVSGQWGTGFGFNISYREPNGLEAGVKYSNEGLIFDHDRYSAETSAAAGSQQSLLSEKREITLTYSQVRLRWGPPPIIFDWFRPYLESRGEVFNLQRPDLGIDEYWRFLLSSSLNLGIEPLEYISFSLGFGYAYEALIELEVTEESPISNNNRYRQLPFLQGEFEFYLEHPGLRMDKRHSLKAWYRDYRFWDKGTDIEKISLNYQKFFEIGYDDLIIRAHGAITFGKGVQWMDESSLYSDTMHAVAGETKYSRKIAQTGLEFRLSLLRDLFKISIMGEVGAFGEIIRDPLIPDDEDETLGWLFGLGPGVHFLILDTFHLSAYYAHGFRESGEYTGRLTFNFEKVY